jgi:hypothetical protein
MPTGIGGIERNDAFFAVKRAVVGAVFTVRSKLDMSYGWHA